MTWPALDDKLLADAAATFNFRLGVPTPLAITRDGAVLFRRTPPREFASDLYELAADGTVRTLATVAELLGQADEQLSDAEKARRERTRTATRGVVDIGVSDDGATVMIPLGGVFHVVDRASGARTTIDPGGPAYDPQLSPDGSAIAFVRDGSLWVAPKQGAPKRIAEPPAGFEYGVAEFVAQEELGRRRGYWWSPDSKSIVFQRTDARGVDTLYVADPRHNERPPVPFKYPRAGRPNAATDLGVVSAAGGAPRWLTWDLAKHGYIADVQWPKGGPLAALVLEREQTEAVLLAFDPASGASRVLLTERDDAWLNVNAGAPKWLEDGSGFLWMTERKGDFTLELRAPDGALVRELTTPELGLRSLVGLEARAAIVEAGTRATHQDVFRIPLDGGAPVQLTGGEGVASARAKHGVIVVDTAREAGGRTTIVIGPGGRRELPSVAEEPRLVPTTVLETVQLGGRTHHVAITRPRAFDRARRYPVLLKVYGGPHVATVLAARDSYVMDQWYADAGFIVVRTDNRGTPNRGRAWERAVLRDLVTVPLEDQVGALVALGARHPELDLSRTGVFGWSFGGYMAAMAALLRPDVFKAAIAGAPVTDWSLYDTAYTERYMKLPADNADGYRATSALTHAGKLARPLLLIHGLTDDNVHFAHTLALIEALYIAAKRAEVITLSATHMVPDPKLNLAREQIQVEFFRQHLGLP
ncbi:MAG TPA: DPP IV N-terminal domain-containing protein [Kofleriaceae bacterium]|nr:DPP IV N-terminal domain-containing protein [Kofleriaceae bacterium]